MSTLRRWVQIMNNDKVEGLVPEWAVEPVNPHETLQPVQGEPQQLQQAALQEEQESVQVQAWRALVSGCKQQRGRAEGTYVVHVFHFLLGCLERLGLATCVPAGTKSKQLERQNSDHIAKDCKPPPYVSLLNAERVESTGERKAARLARPITLPSRPGILFCCASGSP